jgi:glycerol-3-phosphate cytidylyltransferase-like family protein
MQFGTIEFKRMFPLLHMSHMRHMRRAHHDGLDQYFVGI